MKLLITRNLPEVVIMAAKARFETTVRNNTTPLSVEEAAQTIKDYDVILPTLGDAYIRDAFLGGPHRCKLLANFGVGYNHIDVSSAHSAGIAVSNTPGAVTDATADIALTLMLMTCRRAGEGERLVRAGKWAGWHPTQLLGCHMTGKTVGIVGMGRIGQAIAKRCRFGFGMNVVFYNRSPKDIAECIQLDTLSEVLSQSDIVVLAVPGGVATKHLIDADALRTMQSSSYLVNISRGDVIDEAALAKALSKGVIAGAGLDVHEEEPKVHQDFLEMENVTLLPHLGTAALEVRTDMGLMAVDNLIAHLEGRDLPNGIAP